MIKYIYIFLLILMAKSLNAQEILTLEQAINISLKNNYDILVARNNADIYGFNNTAGNAGMLPEISVSGSGSFELNNEHIEQTGNVIKDYPSLKSTSISAGPKLSWTLYDGGRMFIIKKRLNEQEMLGSLSFKEKVQETMYSVISAYYSIVKQKQLLASTNEVIDLNKERVKIAQAGFNAGTQLKTDLLQAKIDLNVALENAITQNTAISSAKKDLNILMGRTAETTFEVTDSITTKYNPDLLKLNQSVDSVNTTVLSYQKQLEIAGLDVKEYNRLYFPTLSISGGYYYSLTNNSDGTTLKNRTLGPQIGGTLTIPLFNSGENRRKINIARLQLKSAEYELQNTKNEIVKELQNAVIDFENQQQLMIIETDNKELTRENFEISLQRMKLGQTTSLEVHQAQENYLSSCTRLVNFQYNLKIAEIKIKQLMAEL